MTDYQASLPGMRVRTMGSAFFPMVQLTGAEDLITLNNRPLPKTITPSYGSWIGNTPGIEYGFPDPRTVRPNHFLEYARQLMGGLYDLVSDTTARRIVTSSDHEGVRMNAQRAAVNVGLRTIEPSLLERAIQDMDANGIVVTDNRSVVNYVARNYAGDPGINIPEAAISRLADLTDPTSYAGGNKPNSGQLIRRLRRGREQEKDLLVATLLEDFEDVA